MSSVWGRGGVPFLSGCIHSHSDILRVRFVVQPCFLRFDPKSQVRIFVITHPQPLDSDQASCLSTDLEPFRRKKRIEKKTVSRAKFYFYFSFFFFMLITFCNLRVLIFYDSPYFLNLEAFHLGDLVVIEFVFTVYLSIILNKKISYMFYT